MTVIPKEDEFRARTLYFRIPQDDNHSSIYLNFDLGRLKSVSNESYLLPAHVDEKEPGQRAREGRIFAEVPTPFDDLIRFRSVGLRHAEPDRLAFYGERV
jgi:hypothetical protein